MVSVNIYNNKIKHKISNLHSAHEDLRETIELKFNSLAQNLQDLRNEIFRKRNISLH